MSDSFGTRIEALGLTIDGMDRKDIQVFAGWRDRGPTGPHRVVLSITAKRARKPAAIVYLGPRQALELAQALITSAAAVFPDHVEAKTEM